jgi:hypothetical protein
MGRENTTPNTWEEAYPAAVGVEIGEISLEGRASGISPVVVGRRRAASRRPSLGVALQTKFILKCGDTFILKCCVAGPSSIRTNDTYVFILKFVLLRT